MKNRKKETISITLNNYGELVEYLHLPLLKNGIAFRSRLPVNEVESLLYYTLFRVIKVWKKSLQKVSFKKFYWVCFNQAKIKLVHHEQKATPSFDTYHIKEPCSSCTTKDDCRIPCWRGKVYKEEQLQSYSFMKFKNITPAVQYSRESVGDGYLGNSSFYTDIYTRADTITKWFLVEEQRQHLNKILVWFPKYRNYITTLHKAINKKIPVSRALSWAVHKLAKEKKVSIKFIYRQYNTFAKLLKELNV